MIVTCPFLQYTGPGPGEEHSGSTTAATSTAAAATTAAAAAATTWSAGAAGAAALTIITWSTTGQGQSGSTRNRLSHGTSTTLRWLFEILAALHVLRQTFLLTELLEAPEHLVD